MSMKYSLPPRQSSFSQASSLPSTVAHYPSIHHTTHPIVFHQTPSCPASSHTSSEISFENPQLQRRTSVASLKDYVDIDKLISDIKITPGKQSRSNQLPQLKSKQAQSIATICRQLVTLRENSIISDEVRTVELLIESIQKKLTLSQNKARGFSGQKQTSSRANIPVSPIKQLWDDPTSRILYTNFSIKEMRQENQQNMGKKVQNQNISDWPQAFTPQKSAKHDGDENQQVEKLNQEINALEQLLKMKGGAAASQNSSNPFIKQISTRPLSQLKQKVQNQSIKTSQLSRSILDKSGKRIICLNR